MSNVSSHRAGAALHVASPSAALAGLSLCMLLPSLGISSTNIALPTLAHEFGAPFQQVQWVVLTYLLANTTLIVGVGRLGDIIGRRRLLLGGIVLFTVASGLCALAPTLSLLMAGRAAQGLGTAALMALAMAFVAETVPKSRTGSAMGLLGTMSAVGTALGPSLGGLLIASHGWRSIFVLNIPLGIVALLLARRHLPADRQVPKPSGFDSVGTLLLALALAAYALAMTWGRGDFGPLNLLLLAAALVGAVLFGFRQVQAESPLIQPARLRNPALRASLVTSALVSALMMATLVVAPFYLGRGLGLGAALVGAVMSAGPVVAALTGVPAGRIVDRFGAPGVVIGGLAAMLGACIALGLAPVAWGSLGYLAPSVVLTAGYALFQAANNTVAMRGVAPEERGVTSALLNLSRNLGLVTGASAMGAIFAWAAGTGDFASAPPEAVATGMRATFEAGAGLMVLALIVARRAAGARVF